MEAQSIVAAAASNAQASSSTSLGDRDTPIAIDEALLCATDLNPIDAQLYQENLESYLYALARDGTQALLSALFSLPTKPSPDGPLGILPLPKTLLPRSKPLPKPKPPTKWEKFAARKGIQHKKRDAKTWDEEKQEWVRRWGKGGKNRELEDQWLTEVPKNADVDFDAGLQARADRKARVEKNEKQRLANLPRSGSSKRTEDLERTLTTTRASTASMGKFDKRLEGEKNPRGIKRKFDSNERSVESEKKQALSVLSSMKDGKGKHDSAKKSSNVLNVRKAIRQSGKEKRSMTQAKPRRRRD